MNKSTIRAESDKLTHQYTLILNPDNTFKVLIDNTEVAGGRIEDHFDIMPPKEISDPEAIKPEEWDDRETVPDETDVKPVDWNKIPEFVVDETATRPDDWNDEEDGVWKAPKKRNPEFKGKWKQRMVANPNYQGVWEPPKIKNPDYLEEGIDLYVINKAGGIGIEIMQIKPGSIFDNFFIGDSVEEALEFSKRTFGERKEKEAEVLKSLNTEVEDKVMERSDGYDEEEEGREEL